jgi:hypothetical protein
LPADPPHDIYDLTPNLSAPLISDRFRLVENTKAKYSILDKDTYNFDVAGFMIGIISTGAVVTGSERQGQPKSVQQGNQEWTTVIQGVNAMGWAIPPFIIFQGKNHLSAWYKEDILPHDWVIAVSENGWTTNALGLEWLKHYHGTETKKVSTKQCCSVPSYGGGRGRYKYRLEGLVGPRESQAC